VCAVKDPSLKGIKYVINSAGRALSYHLALFETDSRAADAAFGITDQ
jgi:hypothetical protein